MAKPPHISQLKKNYSVKVTYQYFLQKINYKASNFLK
jgi:hypothetical protein